MHLGHHLNQHHPTNRYVLRRDLDACAALDMDVPALMSAQRGCFILSASARTASHSGWPHWQPSGSLDVGDSTRLRQCSLQ
jgi:hypothetical protein